MKTSKQDGCLLVQLSTSKIPITFIGITETVPTNINKYSGIVSVKSNKIIKI